jgi:hypothetical protein
LGKVLAEVGVRREMKRRNTEKNPQNAHFSALLGIPELLFIHVVVGKAGSTLFFRASYTPFDP